MKQWNSNGGTVEQSWCNSAVGKSNSHGRTVWWNSETVW